VIERNFVWNSISANFVRNHARSLLACDFFIAVTGSFRVVFVFVVMEVDTRRIAH
jgi:putative transposase